MNISGRMNARLARLKKKSPELLFAAGVISLVGCVVTACKGTIKAVEIKEKMDEQAKIIDETPITEEYTEAEKRADHRTNMIQTGWGMIRTYALPLALGIISISCFGKSHSILKKRCAGLAAAYASLDALFKRYRNGVVDKYGEEEDYKLLHGNSEVTIMDMKEDGTTEKKTYDVSDGISSLYTKYMTPDNYKWKELDGDYELLYDFFSIQENYLNDLLRSRYTYPDALHKKARIGWVTANEMYEACCFDREMNTDEGVVTGVTYDPNRTDGGDNAIRITAKQTQILKDGEVVDAIAVDFNIEGPIYKK